MTHTSTALLRELVAFDSTSRNSNLALIEWAANHLRDCGAKVEILYNAQKSKANLLGVIGPESAGGVVLSGHSDVVPVDGQKWTSNPFVLEERDGRLHGRGSADMKGFIACSLAAAQKWKSKQLKRPIFFAFSYDEEVGCLGAPALVDRIAAAYPQPAFAIVGEPTDMRIGVAHNGVTGFHTRFRGVAAHASDPSLGVNAIDAAAKFISFLGKVPQSEEMDGNRCTLNVGRIIGGAATNIVAERCAVHWEYRTSSEQTAKTIRSLVDRYLASDEMAKLDIASESDLDVPPFASNVDDATLETVQRFGAKLPVTTLPFGSEAGLFERRQIPTVVCGPGSINQAHRSDEWVECAALAQADRFLEGVAAWVSRD